MSPQSPQPARPLRLRRLKRALRSLPRLLAATLALAGCTKPELTPGAIGAPGRPPAVAPWQAAVAAAAEASRGLSEGEGEIVVANAVAAHEMRRP